MYEIGFLAQFEAAHRLIGDFGPATRLHGHTYRLEVTLRGENVDGSNVLMDVGELEARVEEVVSRLHMRELSEVEGLSQVNTTAEAVSRYCWDEIAPHLQRRGFASLAVRVWESPRIFAGYEAPLVA